MKHLILSAALGLGLASMASADPVDGTWKTQSEVVINLFVIV